MQTISTIVLAVQILTALVMIVLILLQHGKGADMGAAFGGGASGSLFGATGSANFLSRTTGVLAAVFFACTLALAFMSNVRPVGGGSVLERVLPAPAAPAAPAVPVPAPAEPGAAGQIPGAAPDVPVPAPQGLATTPLTPAPVPPQQRGPLEQIPAR